MGGRPREQLINLQTDPGEMVNLAVESSYQQVLQEHRDRLAQWCRQTGDEFDIPGDSTVPKGTHYSHCLPPEDVYQS